MATRKQSPPRNAIRFRGRPQALDAVLPVAGIEIAGAPLVFEASVPRVADPAQRPVLHPMTTTGQATALRLALPTSTPPGTYEGTVQVGGHRYPAVIEVDPYPHLVLLPRPLDLAVAPGEEASADLTLVSDGNVACDIGRTHLFGLFDAGGLDRALGAALGTDRDRGSQRLDRLADTLADGHGGLVRVRVTKGAGPIGPGEARVLRVSFRLSDRVQVGRSYFGTWALHNLNYLVRVHPRQPSQPEGEVR